MLDNSPRTPGKALASPGVYTALVYCVRFELHPSGGDVPCLCVRAPHTKIDFSALSKKLYGHELKSVIVLPKADPAMKVQRPVRGDVGDSSQIHTV